jgi:hypothetical protein
MALTFIFEVEEAGQLSAFMVAAKHMECSGICDLESVQVKYTLGGKTPSIDVVPQKQILGVERITADFKELKKVEVLTMYISADCLKVWSDIQPS